jgi:hypothetical protein
MSYHRPDTNCAECGQARPKRSLNAEGVCSWCTLTVILNKPNPAIGPIYEP